MYCVNCIIFDFFFQIICIFFNYFFYFNLQRTNTKCLQKFYPGNFQYCLQSMNIAYGTYNPRNTSENQYLKRRVIQGGSFFLQLQNAITQSQTNLKQNEDIHVVFLRVLLFKKYIIIYCFKNVFFSSTFIIILLLSNFIGKFAML